METDDDAGRLIVAACGRSIFNLQLVHNSSLATAAERASGGSDMILTASPPRAALPSMVVDLAFAPNTGNARSGLLVAATQGAGVYLWAGKLETMHD